MNHWVIAPVVLPAVMASIMVLSLRHHVTLQRVFAVTGGVAYLAIALGLMALASSGRIEVYDLGNWPAPFGIVLVLDRLSALMAVLTATLALGVLLYAIGSGWDARGHHFHPLFQFQLMGIFGAFLTGDAFNLFVFFEVLLIASYGLMIHAGGARRLRAGLQYVVYNLLGSTLFLFALGAIYAATGTLNMADLATRIDEIPETDIALVRVGAVLLLLVFAIKAAILPLHFWLPETYSEAPAPVAALFAIMTKVGAYAILRMYTLVYGPELGATADLVQPLLMGAAVVTLVVGMVGILGSDRLGRLAAFAAIGSMGTVLISLSRFDAASTGATLYYVVHSTLAGALLFLVVDLVRERRADGTDGYAPAPPMAGHGMVAALFFAAAIGMAGMPPFSGFLGKLLILDALRDTAGATLAWWAILATSLVAILGFAQGGSAVFWKTAPPAPGGAAAADAAAGPALPALPVAAALALAAAIVALTVLAGPVMDYMAATAAQLYAPDGYIAAVLAAR
jgi:multicomponent K+:H+ antiporter subunit D